MPPTNVCQMPMQRNNPRSESRLFEDDSRPARKRLEHIGDLPARWHSDAVLDEELFPSCVARQSTLCVSMVIAPIIPYLCYAWLPLQYAK